MPQNQISLDEGTHLYIRLKKPNNEYDERGELVFESSLNMSVNFELFNVNSQFREFAKNAYLEVKVDFSPAKKWLVDRLSLRIIASNDDVANAVDDKIHTITGHRVNDFSSLNPELAWSLLNMLMSEPLPYGNIWTDKQYFPTVPSADCDFKVEYNEEERSWTFSPAGWSDPIFKIRIDEWERPIFYYQPDNSGYPATVECLLSDARRLLSHYRNQPGWWLLNTFLPEKRHN